MSETVSDEQKPVEFPECRLIDVHVAARAFTQALTRVGYDPSGRPPDFAEIRERARRIMRLGERFPQFGMDALQDLIYDPARTVDQSIDCAEQLAAFVCGEVPTAPVLLCNGGALPRSFAGIRHGLALALRADIEAAFRNSPPKADAQQPDPGLHAGFNDPAANPAEPDQL